jgi:N-acetylneuraminate synthase
MLTEFYKRWPDTPLGLSDHSGKPFPGIIAAYLGVAAIEVHLKFSRWTFGPDAAASLTVEQLAALVEGVRYAEKMRAHPVDKEVMALGLRYEREVFM